MDRSEWRQSLDELRSGEPLFVTLLEDVTYCHEAMAAKDCQETRRQFVRAAFGFVEGVMWWLRDSIRRGRIGLRNLEVPEIVLLSGKTFDLTDSGDVRERSAFIKIRSNLLFVLNTHAKAFQYAVRYDLSGDGWARFQAAIAIRNRLVHPKVAADLEVSTEARDDVVNGVRWFRTTVADAVEACSESLRQRVKAFDSARGADGTAV